MEAMSDSPRLTAPVPRLAPDPGLPERDGMLDGEQARATAAALLGCDATDVSEERLTTKYRVGKRIRVAWRVTGPDGTTAIMGTRAPVKDGDRSAWWLADDPRVPGAATLVRPAPGTDSDIVAYVPERTAVARWSSHGETIAFAKAFRDATATTVKRYATLQAHACPVPAVLEHDAAHAVVVYGQVPGQPFADLSPDAQRAAAELLGEQLATMHALSIDASLARPELARFTPTNVTAMLRDIACVWPELTAVTAALAVAVTATEPAPAPTHALVHGDLNQHNVVCDGHRLHCIDLDNMAWAAPSTDLATFLASVAADQAVAGGSIQPTHDDVAAAMQRGYAARGAWPDARAMVWHMGSALVIEAARAIRGVKPAKLAVVPQLLAAAHDAYAAAA